MDDGTGGADRATAKAAGLLNSNPAEAEVLARRVLAYAPQHPQAALILGSALRRQGDLESARAAIEPLAGAHAGAWAAQLEWALVLFALGRTREVEAPLARALQLNPGASAGWRLLADLKLFAGDLKSAQQTYDLYARSMISDPRLRAAADALAEGRADAAERAVRAVAAGDPASVVALYLLGEAQARLNRLDEAETSLRRGLERASAFTPAREALAALLARRGRWAEALAELDLALAQEPANTRCRILKAATVAEAGDYETAAEVTAALLEDFPDQPHGWLLHGNGLRTLGRAAEAVEAYRRCLALDPGCSDAWWALANLKTYRFTAEERAAVAARVSRPDLGPGERANLLFTLAKADEDAGRRKEAFTRYLEANALERPHRAYDPDRTTDFVRRSKAVFTQAFFAERAEWGLDAPDPIFIVGLPRSGSTLVDQILASHPSVEGTRELQEIQTLVDWIAGPPTPGAPPAYPDQLPQMPREAAAQFGADYLAWTRAVRRLGRLRFTDKAPWNFMHLGLIQLILPRAKIIDVRRHPLACCVSAFRQHFSEGWTFTYDLTDLGRYYADYVDLMAHFDRVLPGRTHRVIYEDLVADTEGEVRRLLAYLELPFDERCLRFFETARAVATPSSEQVRRPITTEAVDQWKSFEPWLGPLKAALGPVLDAYPHPPG